MDPLEPLNADIRRALAVEPSPEFLARVRTRIASEPAPSRHVLWMWAASAIVATALVIIAAIVRRPAAPIPPLASAPLAVGAIGSIPAMARDDAFLRRGVSIRSERTAPTRVREVKREPEVLIAADEAKALRQLILGVQEGRIQLAPALAASARLEAITIEPIIITPIPPLTGGEGARP
jgi:hypothetical protein